MSISADIKRANAKSGPSWNTLCKFAGIRITNLHDLADVRPPDIIAISQGSYGSRDPTKFEEGPLSAIDVRKGRRPL